MLPVPYSNSIPVQKVFTEPSRSTICHMRHMFARPLEDGWLQANFGRNGSAYLCQTLQGPQNPR